MSRNPLQAWHACVKARDPELLDALLADDVVFHSPVLHHPQQGKALTTLYLSAAMQVIGNDSFRYLREMVGPSDATLEFHAIVDGIEVNGVDMIHWNADGQISDFKVMVRPWKALETLRAHMAKMLESLSQ